MRCRALAGLVLCAAAVHADDRVGRTADHVAAAVRDGLTARLEWLATRAQPDPWLVADELCFRGAHTAAAAFAAAGPQKKLEAYVASRCGKPADTQARRALEAGQALRIKNYTQRAWDLLRKIKVADDPVLKIRVFTARAKVLRDLGEIHRSDRHFFHAGKLAHGLGWRRRTTESLNYLAYRYCFGSKAKWGDAASGTSADGAMWSTRKKLGQGDAAVVYGAMYSHLLAAVMTKDRSWYVPLGKRAAVEAARASFAVPQPGVPVMEDELHANLVAPLELGQEIERVFVVPVAPFIGLPWVLLFGDRCVVYGGGSVGVTAFGPWESTDGEGVLAIGLPRRKGDTSAEEEALAVGDRVLVGDQATWAEFDDVTTDRRPCWRALHLACPPAFAERWSGSSLSGWARRWMGTQESDFIVLSFDESFRLVRREKWNKGFIPPAPRAIVSLWDVDPEATRALMRRFYALWNSKVSLPACTALKLAQDFVRSQAQWKHPYYWAGWQLWASRDPEKGTG